jgi:apolipoprotein N-acyltransferase
VTTRPRLAVALAAAAAGGLVLSLAFPPAGIWPVAFVAVVPLLLLLRDARPGRGALLGLAFGLASFGAILYWILRFGEMAWFALTLLSGLAVAVFGLLVPFVTRRGHPLRNALGIASLWTVVEWVRSAWPLGGFSWGGLGVSQVDDRPLLRLASVGGVWGITFVVVLVNALIAEAIAGGGGVRARAGRVLLAVALVVVPVLIPFPRADGPEVDVAAIQVDVRVPEGTSSLDEDLIVARRFVDLHRSLVADPPDLVLWGEGALDPAAAADPTTAAAVTEAIASVGVPTVAGAVVNDPDGSQHTSALVFDGSGLVVDRYDKVHLVPFGEYVPWRDRLGWLDAIDQVPVDRVPGPGPRTIEGVGLPSFGTPICFENAFPSLVRSFVRAGATFLVVPVNNASYGFTAAAAQHLQMSRMRAVETGRWVVDAAVSGPSAFVDPQGTVVASRELFETSILRERIRTSEARTLYVRLGDWVPWLSLAFVVGLVTIPRRRTAVRGTPGPLPSSPRTLVILPTYKEVDTIGTVVTRVLQAPEHVDVLVVDDSSPDGTADEVRIIAATDPRVRLLVRPEKSGLASAYLDGFRIALDDGYDLVVEMDSDLSHDPSDLSPLLEAARHHDLTIGSRYVPGGSVTDWSRLRLALSRGGNRYARFMLSVPVHDATSGYRVYRRELLQELLRTPFHSDGYGFQVELVMRADRLGFDLAEVPITFREREHGHSKISRTIVIEALWLFTRWGVSLRGGGTPHS